MRSDDTRDGTCMRDSVTSPKIVAVTGGFVSLVPGDCKKICFQLGYLYAAAQDGRFCYCLNDYSTLTTVTNCTSQCSDGSICGATSPVLYTLWNAVASSGKIVVTLSNTTYTKGQTVTATVNASAAWLIDWGDGSDHSVNSTTHVYSVPGEFIVKGYLESFPYISASVPAVVYEAPNASLVCPENVRAFQNATCTLTTVSQGQDFILTRTYTEPGFSTTTYKIPGELAEVYGSVQGTSSLNTPTTVASGNLIILETTPARAGRVARIEVNAATTGWVAIYGVQPSCTSGAYCWESENCSSGCTQSSPPLSCASTSTLCVSSIRCSAASCAATSTPSTGLKYRFIISFYVTVANAPFTYLLDYLTVEVYEGERIAFGCAVSADCGTGAAKINSRNVSLGETRDQLASYSAASVATPGNFSSSKHLVRVIVRDDPVAYLSYGINCSVASSVPTANVPLPFTAATQAYVLQGLYNLTYTMMSEFIGTTSSWTQMVSMRCQEDVIAPTLQNEIWIPLKIQTPFPITFSKGSPVFISLNLGPVTQYHYKDNATNYVWNVPVLYNATGDYNVTGNVTNALNWVGISTLMHVVPVVTNTWTANGTCLCLAWTNGFEVVIQFPSAPNPPWSANFTATYSGGTLIPLQRLDFGTKSGGGAAVPLRLAFNVTIMTVGNHTVTFTLVNEVSNTTFTTQIEVNAPITGVTTLIKWIDKGVIKAGLGNAGNLYMSNETVVFTPSTLTGKAEKWKVALYPGGEVVVEAPGSNTTLSHIFSVEGEYNITISAYNPVQGWVSSDPITIGIISEITGYKLTDSGEIVKPNITKIVTASFEVLPPTACLMIDFGDKTSVETWGYAERCQTEYPEATYKGYLANPQNISHLYGDEGIYTVRTYAFDGRLTKRVELSVVVADMPCSMPDVNILERVSTVSAAPKIWKSLQFFRATTSKVNCNISVPVTRWWTITQVDLMGAPVKDINIQAILPSWNFSQLTVPSVFLDYGYYELRYFLLVNASKIFPLQRDDYTYVEIIPTPLAAIIIAGSMSSITRGFAQTAFLNPQGLSIDPDFPSDKNFNVTWWCHQLDPKNETLQRDNLGNLMQFNNHSIPPPLEAIKAGLTGGGCYGKGPGTINLNSGSQMFQMQSFVLAEGTFEITAQVSKDTRNSTTSLVIVVMASNPPTMSISCADADLCWPYMGALLVNPSSRLALRGKCIADCSDEMTYSWQLSDGSGKPVVESTGTNCSAADNNTACGSVFMTKKTDRDLAMSTLIFELNPSTFAFKFKLSGTNTITKKTGFAENLILVNKRPTGGTCMVDTTTGYALIDDFLVKCQNWNDPEVMGISTYAFYTYSNGTAGVKKAVLVASGNKEVDLIFPVGLFELRVEIWDVLGSFSDVYIDFINVSMPSKEDFTNFNLSSVLESVNATGDQVKMGMLLVASSSIRENADWLKLDFNMSGVLDADAIARLKEISAMNLDALQLADKTMNFASLPQLNVGAEVLQSSVEGILKSDIAALTVDMATRETALNFLGKMTDQLDGLTVSSPQELVPFVSKSMTAVTALMTGINKIIENPERVPPTDQEAAGNWDYDVDVDSIDLKVPLDRETQLKQNVLDTTRLKAKQQVDKMMEIIESLSTKMQNKFVVGESIATQTESGAAVLMSKVTEEILQGGMLLDPKDGTNATIQFPKNFCPSRHSVPNTDCKQELGITVFVWPCVTHVFPNTKSLISQHSKIIDVAVSIQGHQVDVKNETLPVVLEIPRSPETLPKPITVNASEHMSSVLPFVYHQFTITNFSSAFTLEIGAVDLPPQAVIIIDHQRMPTPSQFQWIKLVQDLPLTANGSNTLFINGKENNNRTGRFFVAVASLKDSVKFHDILKVRNLSREDFIKFTARYTFRVYSSGCYYYDINKEQWSGEGMYPIEVTETLTKCETIHLTPFGSGHFFIPNEIDVQYVFANAGFVDNLTLYIILIFLLVLYIMMMIWARYMDKKDLQYRGVEPLEDNSVEDKYLYEITVTTGPDKEAGTDSNIQFIISGEYNETEVRILPPSEGRRFHRYSVDAFVMATPGPLGDINYLRIWHDNSGLPPFDAWQLQSIVIRDLQKREKFVFNTDTWLAFDRTGTVDVLLKPSKKMFESFSREFYLKGNRSANEDNMWMSIFLRPVGSRFSRKERVSVGALFLYLSMLVNALWYERSPDSPRGGLLNLGPLTISFEQIISGLASGCVVYPFTLLLIFIFKRSRPYRLKKCRALEAISRQRRSALEHEQRPVEDDPINNYDLVKSISPSNPSKDQNIVKCIPWWTRWLAWFFILVGIAACIFLVWSYGVMWGEIKTAKWFSSFIMSFFISILVVQWLNVFIITTIGSVCCRKEDFTIEDIDCDEELPQLNYDEEWKNMKPMDPTRRKKVANVAGVDPRNPYVATLAVTLKKRREMLFVLRDIGTYCMFLLILALMTYGRTDPNAFLMQQQLYNSFIKTSDPDLSFDSRIVNSDWLWRWIQEIVMKEIRAQRLYNKEPPYGLKGFLGDFNNRIMGYGIIRQVRVDPRICRVVKPLDRVIDSCSGTRGFQYEDNRDFCGSWSYIDDGVSPLCNLDEFRYRSAKKLLTYGQTGKLGDYGGGGYVLDLKGAQDDILKRFTLLQERGWIDRYTRAVILEFSVYNANVNLFATASVMAEFNEGGGIIPKWRFEPVRLIQSTGLFGWIVFASECIFAVVTVMFTLNELWKMKKQKCQYFESYWNIAEICIIIVSYGCIGLYVYRAYLTKEATREFQRTNGNGYIRIDYATLMDQFYLYMMSIVIFFSVLKLIKLLQFNKRMDVLALTIRSCWDELSVFFIAFGIIFFAFCMMFFLIFTTAIEDFSKFASAIQTSFKMMLGKFDFQEMNQANPISPILFFVFSVMNSMILINIMLTIILRAFNEVKVELAKKQNKYDIIDFVCSVVRRKMKLEPVPDNSVKPSLEMKKDKSGKGSLDENTEQLPDKVSQLMTYISDMYFNGKVNLNDPTAVKKIMQSTVKSASHRPVNSKLNMAITEKRNVISSD
ncbi:uncharacterized protein LOC135219572 isoform X1 [Macrobrachium nipponense]|uniref:uncharacterized protein LOC135219572 isoform X1 n=3 Tax=Macrobrachium nipponense TaxID=159736 RepID=UPI0030C7A590